MTTDLDGAVAEIGYWEFKGGAADVEFDVALSDFPGSGDGLVGSGLEGGELGDWQEATVEREG